jgi:transposase
LDAAGLSGLASDEAGVLEGEHHLMDRRRCDAEMALEIGLGGRAAGDLCVGVDESQILALLGRKTRIGKGEASAANLIHLSCPQALGAAMNIRYRVELSQAERAELIALVSGGTHAVRKVKRAQILLAADAGAKDEDIAFSVNVGGSTVYRTKRRFVESSLEAALSEEPRPGAERKLSAKEEALLVATACAKPPEAHSRWTLMLLAGAIVKLTDHQELSRETVRRRLAENHLKPWRKDMWCIPNVDAAYVARMEDVLDLYAETADPERPVVCSHGVVPCQASFYSVIAITSLR